MTRKKAVRGKPGPKPGFQPAVNARRKAARAAAAAAAALAAATAPSQAELDAFTAEVRRDPFKSQRRLRELSGPMLKAFARGVDIPRHNVDDLTEDKLRQNCMLKVATIIEAITG